MWILKNKYLIFLTFGILFIGEGRSNDPVTIQLRVIPPSNRLAPLHEYLSMKYLTTGGQIKIAEIKCSNMQLNGNTIIGI